MKIKVVEAKAGYGKTTYLQSELLRQKRKTLCLGFYEEYKNISKRLAGTYIETDKTIMAYLLDFMNNDNEYLFINLDAETSEDLVKLLNGIIEIISENIGDSYFDLIIDHIDRFVSHSNDVKLICDNLFRNANKLEKLNISIAIFEMNNVSLLQDVFPRNMNIREYIYGNMEK
jgi:hypothetical protein